MLTEVKAAEAVAEEMNATPRGRLRISAPVGFGAWELAPALMRFMESYPEIEIELALTDRFVDLVQDNFDAVLRLGPIADSSLSIRQIVQHDQVLCASPSYLTDKGTPLTPEDLNQHDCLNFVNASGLPYSDWVFRKNGVEYVIKVHGRFQVNDGRVLTAAAIAGHGIILQPRAVLREHLERRVLVSLLDDYAAPGRDMALLFPGGRLQTPKMRAFIDFIVASFPYA